MKLAVVGSARRLSHLACVAGAVFAGLAFTTSAAAQTWPTKAITIISGLPGRGDVQIRLLTPLMSEFLGQPVTVENRSGAGINAGPAYVAKANPDGHILAYGSITFVINPLMYQNANFKLSDFTPITQVYAQDNCIAVNPNGPIKSFDELVTYAKASPNKLQAADPGGDAALHMFRLYDQLGLKVLMVPYAGPATNDLMSGAIDVAVCGISQAVPLHKSGKIRIIAWTGTKRKADLPDIPTVSERLPGWTYQAWSGFFAPAATPRDRIDRVQQATAAAIKRPEIQGKFQGAGADPVGSTPDEFAAYIKETEATMTKLINQLKWMHKFES